MSAEENSSTLQRWWRRVPAPIRKTLVLAVGITLIVLGLLLIVLPGPFTIPLIIAGLVVMASEFAWAAVMTEKAKHHGARLWDIAKEAWKGRFRKTANRSGTRVEVGSITGSSLIGESGAVDDAPAPGKSLIEDDGNNKQENEGPNSPGAPQEESDEQGDAV